LLAFSKFGRAVEKDALSSTRGGMDKIWLRGSGKKWGIGTPGVKKVACWERVILLVGIAATDH